MSTVYTDTIVAQMTEIGSFTYETATEFAAKHDLKPRSVIAKIKSLGLDYTAKPARVTKTGAPVVHKSELASLICARLGVEMPGLAKLTKTELETLLAAVA